MALVTVKLIREIFFFEFYNTDDNCKESAYQHLLAGDYRDAVTFMVSESGEKAAEEVFDLSNNPDRWTERDQVYGREVRSLSVGDVVMVEDITTSEVSQYLCLGCGWAKL